MALPSTEQQMIGTLMCNPKLLLQTDKYQIETKDFSNSVYKSLFWAIDALAPTATKELTPHEIEQWLINRPDAKAAYDRGNGLQVMIDSAAMSVSSFDKLYTRFKRENLIRDLLASGYDVKKYYVETPTTEEEYRIAQKYSDSTAEDIIQLIRADITTITGKYVTKDTSQSQNIFEGLEQLLADLKESPEIGLPLQGTIFNYIVGGAITGRFYLRSGSSGLGKTRSLMSDACQLAFPIKYDWRLRKWVAKGYSEKVMIIITEQNFDEVQKMALAYVSGINESTIKKGLCTEEQEKVVMESLKVIEAFKDNFHVIRMPSPTITMVKQVVREQVLLHDIRYVFYDYIFVCPSLLNEFKGAMLRNDEILLMFSDALKQLAVELDIFMMSSTQVNAKADQAGDIRNEASLAGSRAVINKADVGCIMARPTKEELELLKDAIAAGNGIIPNVVTDIYKLRGGENTQTRIWSSIDLGTLSRTDLFVTDARMEKISLNIEKYTMDVDDERIEPLLKILNKEGM